MSNLESDAFVFFGATGDLAYKKIFPALYSLVRRGGFHIPIIGMARAGWTLETLKERARDSVQHSTEVGDFDASVFEKFPKPVQPHLQTLESFIGDVRLLPLGAG